MKSYSNQYRKKRRISTRLTLLNLKTDRFETIKKYTIKPDTIVIFEGVFLFREELVPFIDYKVYLDIPFEESKRRAHFRDRTETISKYDEKYLPAQAKYIWECSPASTADIVIDNTNWDHPKMRNK